MLLELAVVAAVANIFESFLILLFHYVVFGNTIMLMAISRSCHFDNHRCFSALLVRFI